MGIKKKVEFKDFYSNYRDKIYNTIYLKVNDYHVAEDLTQDVFSKVFANWEAVENHYQYTMTTAINKIKNFYEKNKAEKLDEHEYINGNFEKTEIEVFFTTMINNIKLSEIEKEILFLKLKENYTYKEIADVLELHQSAVVRKEKKIKERMKKYLHSIGLYSFKDMFNV